MTVKGKKAPIHQNQVITSKVPYEVFESVVFGERLSHELKGKTVPGEHGAKRHDFGLWTPCFGLSIARFSEKPDDLWRVGQVDIRPIHREQAVGVLPQ